MKCSRSTCDRKRQARGLCRQHYMHAVKTGDLPPSGLVSAGPAKRHIDYLKSADLSLAEISRLSGANIWSVRRVNSGRTVEIYAATEARILRIGAPGLAGRNHGLVGTAGTQRRLRALVAMGHSQRYLAKHLGLDETNMSRVILGGNEHIKLEFARRAEKLFQELQLVTGPDGRARIRAARKNWMPPLAWDEETIDDPDAKPDMGEIVQVWFPEKYAELTELGITRDDHIAARLNITTESVKRMRERYGLKQAA